METNIKDTTPAIATHPGDILRCELQERGLKQREFAKMIGMQPSNLSALIKGKRNVTPDIAVKLENALSISFNFWMNCQANYEYDTKTIEERERAKGNAKKSNAVTNDKAKATEGVCRDVFNALNVSYIADTYFHKSRAWLTRRINGSRVRGKVCSFSNEEKETLLKAFKDISEKTGSACI